jgi:enoyl-CoA hydratase
LNPPDLQFTRQDPFALKLAKASVNETMDIQGQRRALEAAFKNSC